MSTAKEKSTPQIELTGIIQKHQFVNKVGRKIKGAFDYMLDFNDKSYYIKFCESKISPVELEPFWGSLVKARVYLKQGLWDSCGPEEVQSRYGHYIQIYSLELLKDMKTYSYADGSGNRYIITTESIEYIPVQEKESSSGEYSGGDYRKKMIQAADCAKIAKLFLEIFREKSIQIENRVMMSGMLHIAYGDEVKKVIIRQGDKMNRLEKLLAEMLDKN